MWQLCGKCHDVDADLLSIPAKTIVDHTIRELVAFGQGIRADPQFIKFRLLVISLPARHIWRIANVLLKACGLVTDLLPKSVLICIVGAAREGHIKLTA